jgi:hypothetical protein
LSRHRGYCPARALLARTFGPSGEALRASADLEGAPFASRVRGIVNIDPDGAYQATW